jgi:hypothetical protein
MTPTTAKDVNRALRRSFWPALVPYGFADRTDRAAWRQLAEAVDVVDVSSVGSSADAVGCTSYSVSVRASSLPSFAYGEDDRRLDGAGRFRPHYWDSSLQVGLHKTLQQPWFKPFSDPSSANMTRPQLIHREGLMRVIRRDRHDRPDIWFVREDGSNLDEVVSDIRSAVLTVGLPLLDRIHDPCEALALIESGVFVKPDSPIGLDLRRKAKGACTGTYAPVELRCGGPE